MICAISLSYQHVVLQNKRKQFSFSCLWLLLPPPLPENPGYSISHDHQLRRTTYGNLSNQSPVKKVRRSKRAGCCLGYGLRHIPGWVQSEHVCKCVCVCVCVKERNTYKGDINKDKNKETGCWSKRAAFCGNSSWQDVSQTPPWHKPATEKGGPCVVSSEVVVDTQLQYRYHRKPRLLGGRWDRRAFWEVKSLSFNYPEGKRWRRRGAPVHRSPTLFSSFLPLINQSGPHTLRPLLFAVLHLLVVVALPATFALVQHFDCLHQVALEGGQRGANGGGAEAVGEEAEVGEASLDAGLQAGGGSAAAQRRAVLGHEVHKLLTDLPEKGRGRFRRGHSEGSYWYYKFLGLLQKWPLMLFCLIFTSDFYLKFLLLLLIPLRF